jgi:hypothetical protein
MTNFSGRVALVTAIADVIGAATIARALADAGATVHDGPVDVTSGAGRSVSLTVIQTFLLSNPAPPRQWESYGSERQRSIDGGHANV